MAPLTSIYPKVSLEEAWKILVTESRKLIKLKTIKWTSQENFGHYAASDVYAPQDFPSARISIMDGYAVRLPIQTGQTLEVIGGSRPGDDALKLNIPEIPHALYVTTGAVVPDAYDAVVPVEMVEIHTNINTKEPVIKVLANIGNSAQWQRGKNVREIGSDHEKGSLILRAGERIFSAELGTLVSSQSAGIWDNFSIVKPLQVKIMITGNEIIPTVGSNGDLIETSRGISPGENKIYDAIGPMLVSELKASGAAIREESVEAELQTPQDVDLIVTTGGVSMGDTDYLKPIIERNGRVFFGRVDAKPGLPTTFSVWEGRSTYPILSLPGNPVSAWVMIHLLLKPLLDSFLTRYHSDALELNNENVIPYPLGVTTVTAVTSVEACSDGRLEFQRCIVYTCLEGRNTVQLLDVLNLPNRQQSNMKAVTTGNQRSSRLMSLVNANALLIVPSYKKTGIKRYPPVRSTIFEQYPEPINSSASCNCSSESTGTNYVQELLVQSHPSTLHEAELNKDITATHRLLKIGILVVSDRVSRGERPDKSGIEAVKWFTEHHFQFQDIVDCLNPEVSVCPDDQCYIQCQVKKIRSCDGNFRLAQAGCGVIITTGGTGLGTRDVTTQSIKAILTRRCAGLEHLIISEGLKQTLFAALSNPVVGLLDTDAGRHLVLALPGSPNAVG